MADTTLEQALANAEVSDNTTPICTINPDTREISVPAEYQMLGVESDEKVKRIEFVCPKIVGDNIDLSTLNLYVNYRNGNNELNSYLIEDVTEDGDNITFSWLLSRHVTAYKGTVNYIICAKKSDGTNTTNEWNTRIASGSVVEGLEASREIEEQNADIIEQILAKLSDPITVDSELSDASENPVQNKVVNAAISDLASSTLPVKRIVQPDEDADGARTLYSLENGRYILDGRFRPYAGAEEFYAFNGHEIVFVYVDSTHFATYVYVLSLETNIISQYEIMEYFKKCIRRWGVFARAEDKNFKKNSINPNEALNDQYYPTCKAVYDLFQTVSSGNDGTTFTPSVSSDGVLSWTNDGGLENPASVNIKGADATNEQVANAVDTYLTAHPELTTTVQDGAVTFEKLGIGTGVEYKSIPYFTGTTPGVGDAIAYGCFGQVVPVEPGKTYYCSYPLSTQNITNVRIFSAMPEKQFGAFPEQVGTLEASEDGVYTIPAELTTAKAAFFPKGFAYMTGYANEQAGVDALNNGTTGNVTRANGCVIQDVPFTEIPINYCKDQSASLRVSADQNRMLFLSLFKSICPLVESRVAVLGDSLTEQSAAFKQTNQDKWMEYPESTEGNRAGENGGWFAMIARKYNIDWYCAGHGMQWWYSTTDRPNGATAMVRKLIDGDVEPDYVVLEYGTNDILSGNFGTADDEASETATTTVGAMKWCIEALQEKWPSARIIVIMPCLRTNNTARQKTYIDLVDPIIRSYGVRRVYMADDSGITKAMMNSDGVHLIKPYVVNDITYYTSETEACYRYSRCLEAEMLKA